MKNYQLLQAAQGKELKRPPVWMMRQAGRYMKAYRDLRQKYPSFRERSENPEIAVLEDVPTRTCVMAEPAFLRELEGGCQVPIGINSYLNKDILSLTGFVASVDGQPMLKDTIRW